MNRTTKTIARNILSKKGTSKTQMPDAIFHISVTFIVAVVFVMFTLTIYWLRWYNENDLCSNIIIVNAPDSFMEYIDEYKSDDFLVTNNNLIFKSWDASYDYITYGDWMRENYAGITIVFPSNFDEMIENNQKPDILSFYRTNSLEYSTYRDYFVKDWINEYESVLKEEHGIISPSDNYVIVKESGVKTTDEDIYSDEYFLKSMSATVFPLVLFIIILYVSMSAGTNVIAGEKERGTFAAILMTPVKRIHIIMGNVIGVTIKSLIPALICAVLPFLIPFYFSMGGILGLINVFLLVISLAIFICSITILISVLNDSVVSAQTAFLPIFLVMLGVCVTCIQSVGDAARFYYFLPIYGHFYGIGSSINGTGNILNTVLCLVTTGIFSFICIYVSEKLLHKERFTVSGNQITEKDIRAAQKLVQKQSTDYISKPKATIFGYKGKKRTSILGFIIDQILYPLSVLSIFQLLALIPTVILYMRKPEYSEFIYSLKDVSGVPEIISKSFEVMAIFLGDPMFLIFMSLGYIGIIFTYILRVKLRERNSFTTLGFVRVTPVKKYLKGLVLGFVLMGSVYGILVISGQITPSLNTLTPGTVLTILASLLMWIPQGAAEEVMFRGYMLPRQGSRLGVGFALVFSSLLFALFHSMNAGFTPLASINLFLIAFLFAYMDYKEGHIWYSCAAHTMWNFLQGNIFGLEVSGNQGASTLLKATYTTSARNVITGGAFGPEGGLAVTFVTLVALALVVIKWRKKDHDHPLK